MMRRIHDRWSGRTVLMVLAAIATVAVEPAAGISQQQSGNGPCQAPPNGNKQSGEGQKPAPDQGKDLSDCGGVLKPPTTGDTGMVKPAPKEGKTPVIPPPANPQGDQQNGQPQAK